MVIYETFQVVDQLNENQRLVNELETDWQDKVEDTKKFITQKGIFSMKLIFHHDLK